MLFAAMTRPAEGLCLNALLTLKIENSLLNIPRLAKARPYGRLGVRGTAVSVILIKV
jgi:hypothetical protein